MFSNLFVSLHIFKQADLHLHKPRCVPGCKTLGERDPTLWGCTASRRQIQQTRTMLNSILEVWLEAFRDVSGSRIRRWKITCIRVIFTAGGYQSTEQLISRRTLWMEILFRKSSPTINTKYRYKQVCCPPSVRSQWFEMHLVAPSGRYSDCNIHTPRGNSDFFWHFRLEKCLHNYVRTTTPLNNMNPHISTQMCYTIYD